MLDVHEKCRVGQTGQPYNDQQALHKSSQKRNVGQRSNPADDNMNSSSSLMSTWFPTENQLRFCLETGS